LRAFVFLAAFASAGAAAQEIVTLATRAGVTQSFVILGMEGRPPEAVAILYVGGGGRINLRREKGEVKFSARNFLPRSGAEFARNGLLAVVMDAPSDQVELTEGYRTAAEQTVDTRAVVHELKKRYPALPIFLVGTSRGTISVAYLGRDLGGEVAGVVLTSTMFGSSNPRRQAPTLRGFDYSRIKTPLLFVHHRDDACEHTPYVSAAKLAPRYALVSVKGGTPAESPACEPLSAHGFYGVEAPTVDAICAWMLNKPFVKEIG
jgi:predicted alpha/beta-hydrolase family hydrolase